MKRSIKNNVSVILVIMILLSALYPVGIYADNETAGEQTEILSPATTEKLIKVVQYTDGEETVIFTGPLSEYDNGAWAGMDFTEARFAMIFDWDTDDTYYIIPLDISNDMSDIMGITGENAAIQPSNLVDGIEASANILYNGAYYENILYKDAQLSAEAIVKNTTGSTKDISIIVALYDENGKLKNVSSNPAEIINGSSQTLSAAISIPNLDGCYVKVFVWDSESLKPYTNSLTLSNAKKDHFGNSFEMATAVQTDIDVNGAIDTSGDLDFIKFTVPETKSYAFHCFSTSGVYASLYNASGAQLRSNSSAFEYSLTAGNMYYVKISKSSGIGEYLFSVKKKDAEAADFDIYEFDEDMNIYKQSILKRCEDLYYEDDLDRSMAMYNQYEQVLAEDAKLHDLPEFLAGHPKELSDFDTLINQYYQTKYTAFMEIKAKYIELIDEYTDWADNSNTLLNTQNSGNMEDNTTSDDKLVEAIIGKSTLRGITRETAENEDIQPLEEIQLATASPTLSIVSKTSTSITYDVNFPESGKWGNTIYLIDFNKQDGLTTWENVYGTDEKRKNGRYTITGLSPGGIYILNMMWSTDGVNYGYENSIHRFIQLPDNSTENLKLYSGGRVTARLEQADKELASSSDFNTWLDRMDKAYNKYKELTGYTPYNSSKIEMRSTRTNLNDYFDITDGHNYWEVIFGYYDYTNVFKHSRAFYQGHMRRLSKGDWGDTAMHELSHVFDNDKWVFDSETLAQLKLYYVVEQLNAKVYRPDRYDNNSNGWYTGDNYYDLLRHDRYLDSYDASFGQGEYASEGFAVVLIDIQREIGWDAFKKTFRYFNNLSYSQVPGENGEILKLFLTKLKDYSGRDVLSDISNRDKRIIEDYYGVDMEYVDPVYPEVPGRPITGGGKIEINVPQNGASVSQFTPDSSDYYNIYTSPFGGSGVSNDTYIEVYTSASCTGTPIASNDDYDGGRFSKVNVYLESGTTYYIKVRHYKSGQVHADLNITRNIPIQPLTLDGYEDIITANGEYAVFCFTPQSNGTYIFEAGGHNGGTATSDTYLKLYTNESMTNRIGNHNNKIMVNLKAGQTYYLQFSGFLMKYAKSRIYVRQAATLEFKKRTDSSFIYVNSPEFITRYDIVDGKKRANGLGET